MTNTDKDTTVVIVGAGVAGLAVGNFLLRSGISCVVLERHTREHVEERQRAGGLDPDAVLRLHEWGLAEVVDGHGHGDPDAPLPLLIDGEQRQLRMEDEPGSLKRMFLPQQVLIRNLTEVFLRDGGDLRFEAADVSLHDVDGPRPLVRYRDANGATRSISCDFIAGCDGFHGVSRTAVPADLLTSSTHEFGYAWLSVLAQAPADPLSVLAVHSRGFAARITRGPQASRIYLQCPLADTVDQWPDERIWSELETRFGAPVTDRGPIVTKQVVPLRGVVFSPMSHGRLYLLGDAAHLISPMSARGVCLALHDADVFARAVVRRVVECDSSLLDSYSATCLEYTWQQQASAVWMTETIHEAGDASYEGEFRRQIARRNLEAILEPVGSGHSSA
ncbi:4-hydroxybenzoate 3-monooxygenase [Kitasatospora sp. NPDC089797]|uniref:4-hydroxybenzoate 3-monooxygenase n=1 Tax=Kitasatospora sp. NPDC089797 TaxID=3155298 RepID=UPI003446DE65